MMHCLDFIKHSQLMWTAMSGGLCPQQQSPFMEITSLFQAHGRNLLSIDFDRNTRTEKIYDDHRKFTLRITYDAQGRPAIWQPSSSLAVVNVSYSSTGRLVGLHRGSMSERTEFDQQGRILSRAFVDGKVWSYSYLDKVIVNSWQFQIPSMQFQVTSMSANGFNAMCSIVYWICLYY